MTKLTLTNCVQGNATLIENEFIDKYMAEANGEFVKVYLLILRYQCDPSLELGISEIADLLGCTERDVNRALDYWKKKGLLNLPGNGRVSENTEGHSAGQTDMRNASGGDSPAVSEIVSEPAPDAPPAKKAAAGRSRTNRAKFREIVHVTEQYLGKTLNRTESDAIIYFYDELAMSADLIEYLIEYCVENGHKSMHYIKKVALSWADQKVQTIEEAKAVSGQYSKNSYAVLNAYGIRGRAPAVPELSYIRRWNDEYGFSSDLIVEACNRTMSAIHQPSFDYTESILRSWMERGVKTLADVQALDTLHAKEKSRKKAAVPQANARSSRNRFNNFEGRRYQNMDELTRRLIETQ